MREALLAHEVEPSIEIVSMADIPSGTGLGSSGAFTVGLLRAIYAMRRDHVSAGSVADEACRIEIDRLSRPVGKQDQYVAAFGGVKTYSFQPDGTVTVAPSAITHGHLPRSRRAPADVLHRILPGRRPGARGTAGKVAPRATPP